LVSEAKLGKKSGFLSATFYGMKKNYDICTAKPETRRKAVALSSFRRIKQDKQQYIFTKNDKS